ncbi:MAG: hypothetical protein VR68_15825 [Peptococcaceae bacterium BRH_c4a]|nr:MAG: hypothetical protein VR68_15825 [Peptococcaceae bacterium BRH_c4a]
MKFETDGQVGDLLEGLVEKIERINREKNEEFERSKRALSSMDKLNEAMARLEFQRRRENLMAKKISRIYDQLEKGTGVERGTDGIKSATHLITGFLNGAKATGQVIEIVAGSLMVMMDTVSNVIKNQSAGSRGHSPGGESKGLDLAALLKPVNVILNSLAAKQQQQQQSQQPATSDAPKSSDPKPAGQPLSKDDNTLVQVVRAVPASNGTDQDNS